MSKRTFHFNIHDLLSIKICDQRSFLNRLIGVHDRYMAYLFEQEGETRSDIEVILGTFDPDINGCIKIDNNFYMKEDYLYVDYVRSKLGGKIRFDVIGLEQDHVTLHINSNITGSPFVAGRIIDFFIGYILTQKGYSLIHASGVSKNEVGVVFSARGGGGKTTTALNAVQTKGFKYMGDNFMIIGINKMWGLLSDINFFGYNINRDTWKKLSLYEKIKYRIVMAVYFLTKGYIKIFLPISPLRLLGNAIQNNSDLNKFFSIVTRDRFIGPREISREVVIDRTVINLILEFPFISQCIDEYRCVFQGSFFSNYWTEYEKKLQLTLGEGIDYYEIVFPQHIGNEILDELFFVLKLD